MKTPDVIPTDKFVVSFSPLEDGTWVFNLHYPWGVYTSTTPFPSVGEANIAANKITSVL